MSNLGLYQWMTKIAKKVGGPVNFMVLLGATGAVLERTVEFGLTKVYKNRKACTNNVPSKKIYKVMMSERNNEGVEFSVGEQFRVLEIDGDAVLIEKLGDNHNPYFVSGQFLEKISNFINKKNISSH